MKKTRKINKFIVLFLSGLLLAGCNNKTDSNKQQDDVVDNEESNNETITIGFDAWDIDPVYEFDDIDVEFNRNALIDCRIDNFIRNHESPYEYVDEGGVIITLGEYIGFMNKNGEIQIPPDDFIYISRWFHDDFILYHQEEKFDDEGFVAGLLQKDYTYIRTADGYCWPTGPATEYYLNSNNEVVMSISIEEEPDEVIDLYQYALDNNYIKDGDIIGFSHVLITNDSIIKLDVADEYLLEAIGDNIALLSNDTNVSYYDKDGVLVASDFQDGYPFYEGYAAVKKDGKWGYIDKQGNVVVDFIFDKATSISNGKAWVIYNSKTGRLNFVDMINNNVPFTDEYLNVDAWKSDGKKRLEVTADALKKRQSPSTSSDRVGRVAKGSILIYTDTTTADGYTWYKLEDGSYIADQNREWIKVLS